MIKISKINRYLKQIAIYLTHDTTGIIKQVYQNFHCNDYMDNNNIYDSNLSMLRKWLVIILL